MQLFPIEFFDAEDNFDSFIRNNETFKQVNLSYDQLF